MDDLSTVWTAINTEIETHSKLEAPEGVDKESFLRGLRQARLVIGHIQLNNRYDPLDGADIDIVTAQAGEITQLRELLTDWVDLGLNDIFGVRYTELHLKSKKALKEVGK